jgi:hypothetical protein
VVWWRALRDDRDVARAAAAGPGDDADADEATPGEATSGEATAAEDTAVEDTRTPVAPRTPVATETPGPGGREDMSSAR